MFLDSIAEKETELDQFYAENDFKNYTINVHALKSSARIIGAADLGQDAQMLEDAGKRNDYDYIKEHHVSFMEKLQSFKEPLSNALHMHQEAGTKKASGPIASRAMMASVYGEIKVAAREMDYERLDQIFDRMKDFRIPEDEQKLFDELKNADENFRYDTMLKLLS